MLFKKNLKNKKTQYYILNCFEFLVNYSSKKGIILLEEFDLFYKFFICTRAGTWVFFFLKNLQINILQILNLKCSFFFLNDYTKLTKWMQLYFSTLCKSFSGVSIVDKFCADFIIYGSTFEFYVIDSKTLYLDFGLLETYIFTLPEYLFFEEVFHELFFSCRIVGRTLSSVRDAYHQFKRVYLNDKYRGIGIYGGSEFVTIRLSKKILKKKK